MSENVKIISIKCKKCGYLQQEDHRRCIKCKNDTFEIIEAKGDGILLTYTILNAPPMEFRDKQLLVLGVVEFENGIKAFGQIATNDNLKIGMKLTTVYAKICNNLYGNEIYGYIFKPIE